MRSGATEALLRRTGVTFVCVAPGFSSTAMTSVIGETERPTLMRMIGQTEEVPSSEVAKYTIFAASSHLPDELNGQVIPVYKPMKAPVALGGK
jgi:NAD(P)-dependent dehydrogenase (short-subunit alcohol dehydrogenase family)